MARKINVKLILELRDAGMSRSSIASTRKFSRNSVSDVFNIADEKRITFDDVRNMSDEEAYRLFYPDKYVNEIMYADPDYEYVHKELSKVGVTLKLLHEEYVDKCHAENTMRATTSTPLRTISQITWSISQAEDVRSTGRVRPCTMSTVTRARSSQCICLLARCRTASIRMLSLVST